MSGSSVAVQATASSTAPPSPSTPLGSSPARRSRSRSSGSARESADRACEPQELLDRYERPHAELAVGRAVVLVAALLQRHRHRLRTGEGNARDPLVPDPGAVEDEVVARR